MLVALAVARTVLAAGDLCHAGTRRSSGVDQWTCAVPASELAAHSAGVIVFIDKAWICSRMRSPKA